MKQCPKCKKTVFCGNYCSECGTALEPMPTMEETCPCCGGTGKIKRYGQNWYRWQKTEPQAVINQTMKLHDGSGYYNKRTKNEIQ